MNFESIATMPLNLSEPELILREVVTLNGQEYYDTPILEALALRMGGMIDEHNLDFYTTYNRFMELSKRAGFPQDKIKPMIHDIMLNNK